MTDFSSLGIVATELNMCPINFFIMEDVVKATTHILRNYPHLVS